MAASRRMWAYPLAALAASGVVVSLWLPWYSFKFPPVALDQAESLSSQFGILGPLVRQGAELLRNLVAIKLSGWQALDQVDVGLVLAAVIGGGLALLVLAHRATGIGRVIAWAGGIAVVLSGFRTLFPPGPPEALHAAWGAYFAVCCSAIMLTAGLFADAAEQEDSGWAPAAPPAPDPGVAWSTAGSAAPPGS